MKEQIHTIQLTSKRFKAHLVISYILIVLGVLLIMSNSGASKDTTMQGWGATSTLFGFILLGITRVRIWWNHK